VTAIRLAASAASKPAVNHDAARFTQNKLYFDEPRTADGNVVDFRHAFYRSVHFSPCIARVRE